MIEQNNLMIVCPHVMKGYKAVYETKQHAFCIDCTYHFKKFGVDENGYLKVPEGDPVFGALRAVCRDCLRSAKKNTKSGTMTEKQVDREWKKLKFELLENKPKIDGPYPPDVVKRRELLLYAQVHLSELSWAKKCKDSWTERLETEAYNSVMSEYDEWGK